MKKLVLLSAVLFGTVVASQAGVHLNIGIGFPFPRSERVIVGPPVPVFVERAPVCAPVPVYFAPHYYAPPRIVYVPAHSHYHSTHHYAHGRDGNYRDHGRSNDHRR